MDAEEVAAAFGLGQATSRLMEAARGGGGHNVVYRLETRAGTWAVKEMRRELDDLNAERFGIELAAFAGGIRMPRPVAAAGGGPCAAFDGVQARCHEWTDGAAKRNEDTDAGDARLMGTVVAQLHALALPWSARHDQSEQSAGGEDWSSFAEAGARRGASWSATLAENLPKLERLSESAAEQRGAKAASPRVGSHRDLNAHNVLFSDAGLSLIDWDAAGPASPRWERAVFATEWSARQGDRYSPDAVLGFLRGYRDAGGDVEADDPDALIGLIEENEGWVRKNLRWAIAAPSELQDARAKEFLENLLTLPAVIERRQRLLGKAIRTLSRS